MTRDSLRILGVDPGINITGYGCITVFDREINVVEAGVIKPRKSLDLSKRLSELHSNFCDIVDDVNPDIVVVEEIYSHVKYPKTAIIMGHARGALLLAAGLKNIDVVNYSANRIKKSLTGNGHASKEQMQHMVMKLLDLDKPPNPPDVADALSVAICHANACYLT